MRVAFVSMLTVHHDETPATERIDRLARQLADRGHDVTVLCARWWNGETDTFTHKRVRYRALTAEPSVRSFGWKLVTALRSVAPDVIHAVNNPPSHVKQAARGGTLARAPLVVDWWDDVADDSQREYRVAAQRADAIVTPSRATKTTVREHGAAEDAIRVIPESVDMDLVREASVDDRADLVYARDLDADSNVESFLLALAELRDRDWRATIVGDGPDRHHAERMVRDLRIDDRVEFLGDMPIEERVPIFKGAHVFVQTAYRESFATNLLWALACGCVGIVEYQAQSSAHELVEGRDRGRRVTSPQEIAEEIEAAGSLSKLDVDETFDEFDRRAFLEQYLDCYRDVMDEYGLF